MVEVIASLIYNLLYNQYDYQIERYKMKPKYLYHGSPYKFDVVKPQQAYGKKTNESLIAIYAYDKFEYVIPFALPIRWYPDAPEGKRIFTTSEGKTYIEYGTINPNGIGYVYQMPSNTFSQIENGQWVSFVEVEPIEVSEINVKTYWNRISFSTEAAKIQQELYGII